MTVPKTLSERLLAKADQQHLSRTEREEYREAAAEIERLTAERDEAQRHYVEAAQGFKSTATDAARQVLELRERTEKAEAEAAALRAALAGGTDAG